MTQATPGKEYTPKLVRLHLALELSAQKWQFERRFAQGGVRARKVGIVALTRRLLIQLWNKKRNSDFNTAPGEITPCCRSVVG